VRKKATRDVRGILEVERVKTRLLTARYIMEEGTFDPVLGLEQ